MSRVVSVIPKNLDKNIPNFFCEVQRAFGEFTNTKEPIKCLIYKWAVNFIMNF